MSIYIALANWTDPGARNIAASPKRLDATKKMLSEMGGEIKAFYMTIAQHDIVMIYEAPDDAVAARFMLKLGQDGNVRTQTLKAFPEQAYREIVASM